MTDSSYRRGQRIVNFGKFVVCYVPVLSFLDMWIHVGMLLLGYDVKVADLVFSLPILYGIAFFFGSLAYGYCKLHRCLILYTMLVSYCINHQHYFNFGTWLIPCRWIVFSLGCLLFIWLVINRCKLKSKHS